MKSVEVLDRVLRFREARRKSAEARHTALMGKVRGVDESIALNQQAFDRNREHCMEAAASSDRGAWLLAERQASIAWSRHEILAEQKLTLQRDLEEQKSQLLLATIAVEQTSLVREGALAAMRLREEKRQQGVSDDRFAARRHWKANALARSRDMR